MDALCRTCLTLEPGPGPRCRLCGSTRVPRHPALFQLSLAHLDCDAFFAAVEKRDDPRLAALPVIVGGGRRGVVSTACYVARLSGVRSAMPMHEALTRCPDAVVLRPDMARYADAARAVRRLIAETTPLFEAASIDEAYLDLRPVATPEAPAALRLAHLQARIERELNLTVSIGLAPNRMLAKLASERDKPRGFAVLGVEDGRAYLAGLKLEKLPGIGPATARRLRAKGAVKVGDLPGLLEASLTTRPARFELHLAARARGQDDRPVHPVRVPKSVGAERTFHEDETAPARLAEWLDRVAGYLATRLAARDLAALHLTLKVKSADFQVQTLGRLCPAPLTQAADLAAFGRQLLDQFLERHGRPRLRLIGLTADQLAPARPDPSAPGDLLGEPARATPTGDEDPDDPRTRRIRP